MKITKTFGKLHFDDLSPQRFEDLCLSIIYRYRQWFEIDHYGRTGGDDGIDIYASDLLENGNHRSWVIQCKRYIKITTKELKDIVDLVLKKNEVVPDIFMVIIACDIRKDKIQQFKTYANKYKIKNPIIMTASILEAELYAKHHDLLFTYFGINLLKKRNNKIATIRKKIQLKHRMEKDFRAERIDHNNRKIGDTIRFGEILIRSIDDTLYPDNEINSFGISSWFKVETFGFYHNGLSVITNIVYIGYNSDKTWDIVEYDNRNNHSFQSLIKAFTVSRIPYQNIITYDLSGDEYYNFPHLFCDFANNGTPYEEILYYHINDGEKDNLYQHFDNNLRCLSKM